MTQRPNFVKSHLVRFFCAFLFPCIGCLLFCISIRSVANDGLIVYPPYSYQVIHLPESELQYYEIHFDAVPEGMSEGLSTYSFFEAFRASFSSAPFFPSFSLLNQSIHFVNFPSAKFEYSEKHSFSLLVRAHPRHMYIFYQDVLRKMPLFKKKKRVALSKISSIKKSHGLAVSSRIVELGAAFLDEISEFVYRSLMGFGFLETEKTSTAQFKALLKGSEDLPLIEKEVFALAQEFLTPNENVLNPFQAKIELGIEKRDPLHLKRLRLLASATPQEREQLRKNIMNTTEEFPSAQNQEQTLEWERIRRSLWAIDALEFFSEPTKTIYFRFNYILSFLNPKSSVGEVLRAHVFDADVIDQMTDDVSPDDGNEASEESSEDARSNFQEKLWSQFFEYSPHRELGLMRLSMASFAQTNSLALVELQALLAIINLRYTTFLVKRGKFDQNTARKMLSYELSEVAQIYYRNPFVLGQNGKELLWSLLEASREYINDSAKLVAFSTLANALSADLLTGDEKNRLAQMLPAMDKLLLESFRVFRDDLKGVKYLMPNEPESTGYQLDHSASIAIYLHARAKLSFANGRAEFDKALELSGFLEKSLGVPVTMSPSIECELPLSDFE